MTAAGKRKKRSVLPALLFTAVLFFLAGVFAHKAFAGISSLPEYKPFAKVAKIPENRFLILVNSENSIPDDYLPELTTLANGETVDSEIYPHLQKMFDDMRAEDIYPIVGEGYRTYEKQRQLLEDKIRAFENEGYSHKKAEQAALEYVAEPGKSEHQLGLAVDINADKELSDNQQVYDWLYENAWRYGFILRYPIGKTSVTGTAYEPWHYRYVGDCAGEIHKSGLCLEEWLRSEAGQSALNK